MKNFAKKIIDNLGYKITKKEKSLTNDGIPVDIIDPYFIDLFKKFHAFTFTSIEPMYSLYQSVKYIINNDIPGDFVECGVWKGGSAMLIAKILLDANVTDRKLYLYDTFEGMSEPTNKDVDFNGNTAMNLLKDADKFEQKSIWCYSAIDEVKENLYATNYPKENFIFIQGKVEDTIPQTIPSIISLLRLDTDWYESTYHELIHLYPLLSNKGILIIDDYGHWKGSREATDNYFKEHNIKMLLNRVDYTVRVGIK